MTQYEIYVFFLCFIVFVLLVSLFGIMLYSVVKQQLRLIRGGLEDEKIKNEYLKEKESTKRFNLCGCFVSIAISLIFIAFFIFSFIVNIREDVYFEDIPTLKVVNSASMSRKHEKNEYLFKNHIDDQFQTFDLVFVYKAPKEKDIKLYDIVVYEVNDTQVIHRVVGIEEPNEAHPQEHYFLCQGDAFESPDRFPVYYSQIKGIYKGKRIPFIGSFVKFMQSPAGWLCALLIVFGVFGMPYLEKKLTREIKKRLITIGFIDEYGNIIVNIPFEENEAVTAK